MSTLAEAYAQHQQGERWRKPAPVSARTRSTPFQRNADGSNGQVVLSQMQHLAGNPEYARENPNMAAMHAWRSPSQLQNTTGYRLGQWLRPHITGKSRLGSFVDQGPLQGAGAGAGIGALGGLLGHLALSSAGSLGLGNGSPGLMGMLAGGAGVGGLLGGASGHYRSQPLIKPASYRGMSIPQARPSSDPRNEILAILRSQPMSFGQKSQMMAGVSQLSPSDTHRLHQLLSTAGGAGIGALIMRFLMGKGLGGTLLGAAIGGFLGNRRF